MNDPAPVDDKPNRGATLAHARWSKKRENDAARNAGSGGVPHPLFPTEADEPIPDIRWIDVVRFTPGVGPVQHPRCFPAEELQGLEDIANQFGGGVYELRGRAAFGDTGTAGPIMRRVRYTLEGEPIPFSGDQAPSMQAGAAPAQPPANDPTTVLLGMMQNSRSEAMQQQQAMMQMLIAMMQSQATAQAASFQNMVQLLVPVLSGNKGPDVGQLLGGIAAMSQAQFQQVASLIPKETVDPMERFQRMLELAKGLTPAQEPKGESVGDFLEGLGQAFAGFAAVEQIRQQGPGAPPQAPGAQVTPTQPPPPAVAPAAAPPGEAGRLGD